MPQSLRQKIKGLLVAITALLILRIIAWEYTHKQPMTPPKQSHTRNTKRYSSPNLTRLFSYKSPTTQNIHTHSTRRRMCATESPLPSADHHVIVEVKKHHNPYRMSVHKAPDIVSDALKRGQLWESGILNKMLLELKASHTHPADNTTALIIDIGANIGFFTTYLASEGYDVIAVEPFAMNMARLMRTVCMNTGMADRVHAYKFALLDKGEMDMCLWSTNQKSKNGNARLTSAFHGSKDWDNDKDVRCMERIQSCTLDHLLFEIADAKLTRRPLIMKMDIEGSETKTLRGATRLLASEFAPCFIFFEHQRVPTETTGAGHGEIFDILTGAGYVIYDVEVSGGAYTREKWEKIHIGDFRAMLDCGAACGCLGSVSVATQDRTTTATDLLPQFTHSPAWRFSCPKLDEVALFGRICSSTYRKPGPDHLCHTPGGPNAPPSPWLQRLPHAIHLPSHNSTCLPTLHFPAHPQRFSLVEFQCYSQNTEDGILLALLLALGTASPTGRGRGIEIAGGLGWENNLINLAVNFDFDVLFFDGDPGNSRCARNFLQAHPATAPRYEQGVWWSSDFVTRDNFNAIIANITQWSGEIDVLSIDIDGMDFWLWDALHVVRPRIVVVEIQARPDLCNASQERFVSCSDVHLCSRWQELWGPTLRRTRPYNPAHVARGPDAMAQMGASLGAFTELARRRGYRLAGCIRRGFNAFFVHEDAGDLDALLGLGAYDPAGCFAHVDAAWQRVLDQRRAQAQRYAWVDPFVEAHALGQDASPTAVQQSQTNTSALLALDAIFSHTQTTLVTAPSVLIFTMDSITTQVQASKHGGPAGEIVVRESLQQSLRAFGCNVDVATSDDHYDKLTHSQNYNILIFDPWTVFEKHNHKVQLRDIAQQHKNDVFVLDFFGVESNKLGLPSSHILTAFPVSSRTFLGFSLAPTHARAQLSQDRGIIWGKETKYYSSVFGKSIVDAASSMCALVSIANHPTVQHPNITFLGPQSTKSFQSLLQSSKFLLGLGHPLSGPSGLEAMQAGAMLIIPKFSSSPYPMDLDSQHPYMASAIGAPYVCSFQVFDSGTANTMEVQGCIRKALTTTLEPKIPYDFQRHVYDTRVVNIFGLVQSNSSNRNTKRTGAMYQGVVMPNPVPVQRVQDLVVDAARQMGRGGNTTRHKLFHIFDGRLGNQLFQWASLHGIAHAKGLDICLAIPNELQQFEGPTSCFDTPPKTHLPEVGHSTYTDFAVVSDAFIDGYLQSYRYFDPNLTRILHPPARVMQEASSYLYAFRDKTLVGIHIRDYEAAYLRKPPAGYFDKAMHWFRSKFQNAQFIVASDNIDKYRAQVFWVRDDVHMVPAGQRPVVDMAILSLCDHSILSVGTFGWWAAFLGPGSRGGTVVYYDREFDMTHPTNRNKVVLDDYYPRTWISMGGDAVLVPTDSMNRLVYHASNTHARNHPPYALAAVVMLRIFDGDKMRHTFREVREWMAWMRHAGVEHVYVYDNWLHPNESLAPCFAPYIAQNLVTYIAFPGLPYAQKQLDAYAHWLRTYQTHAEWVFVGDFDEYPHMYADAGPGFLRRLAAQHQCAVYFQNQFWVDVDQNKSDGEWLAERYVRRDRNYERFPYRSKVMVATAHVTEIQVHGAKMRQPCHDTFFVVPIEQGALEHYWGTRMVAREDDPRIEKFYANTIKPDLRMARAVRTVKALDAPLDVPLWCLAKTAVTPTKAPIAHQASVLAHVKTQAMHSGTGAYPLDFIPFCKRRWNRMSTEWIVELSNTTRDQHVLLVMGLLDIGFDGSGSFTGDIMQWCDLAAGLQVVGTRVSVYGGKKRHRYLPSILTEDFDITAYSLIFIDYLGLGMFQRMYAAAKQDHLLNSVACRLRILDEFGTEQSFIRENRPIPNRWVPPGIHLLEQQILTFEPHHIQEGDFHQKNTFLGYTVSSVLTRTRKPEWRGLLWGKRPEYFENVMPMLRLLCEFVPLTTTVRGLDLPSTCLRVVGRLPDDEYLPFVQSHALYVGTGEPAMGFGGAEATAMGLMVLNPRHDPPWTVDYGTTRIKGSPVLQGKPTRTIFKYQNTILGDDLSLEAGQYVHNVNVHNLSDVKRVIANVREIYDTVAEGMTGYVSPLLRVGAFCSRLRGILTQDFCRIAFTATPTSRKKEKHASVVNAFLAHQASVLAHVQTRHAWETQTTHGGTCTPWLDRPAPQHDTACADALAQTPADDAWCSTPCPRDLAKLRALCAPTTFSASMENDRTCVAGSARHICMSVDSRADVHMQYFGHADLAGVSPAPPAVPTHQGFLASFVSNCVAWRTAILQKISDALQARGLTAHHYGHCLHNADEHAPASHGPSNQYRNKNTLAAQHRYTFAFENSETSGYVTEKLFYTLGVPTTVAVYRGAADVRKFLPAQDAAWVFSATDSAEDIARALATESDVDYARRHRWRNASWDRMWLANVDYSVWHSTCRACVRARSLAQPPSPATGLFVREMGFVAFHKVPTACVHGTDYAELLLCIASMLAGELSAHERSTRPHGVGAVVLLYRAWDREKCPLLSRDAVEALPTGTELEAVLENPCWTRRGQGFCVHVA